MTNQNQELEVAGAAVDQAKEDVANHYSSNAIVWARIREWNVFEVAVSVPTRCPWIYETHPLAMFLRKVMILAKADPVPNGTFQRALLDRLRERARVLKRETYIALCR